MPTPSDQRWDQAKELIRLGKVSINDVAICPRCGGPALLGTEIPVDEEGRFQLGARTYEAYPGFVAREIKVCSRCKNVN